MSHTKNTADEEKTVPTVAVRHFDPAREECELRESLVQTEATLAALEKARQVTQDVMEVEVSI